MSQKIEEFKNELNIELSERYKNLKRELEKADSKFYKNNYKYFFKEMDRLLSKGKMDTFFSKLVSLQ